MTPQEPSRAVTARVALAASVAVVASILAAFGPAVPERTVLHRTSTSIAPSEPSGATAPDVQPVLLTTHVPERLTVVVPCAAGTEPGVLVATTADPAVAGRLVVEVLEGALVVRRAAAVVTEVALSGAACPVAFEVRTTTAGVTSWTLARDGTVIADGVTDPPLVSGLSVAARASGEVDVTLVSAVASTHPSTRQWVLLAVAVAALGLALLGDGSTWRAARDRGGNRRTVGPVRPAVVDVAVVAALATWAALGPWFFDDGWLMATVRARDGSGSFTNYFDTLAAQMPLGFAHHVLLRPFAMLDAPFLLWRIVPLAACIATWFVVRRMLDRACSPSGCRAAALVTMALGHLVASAGFLLTLRPEPVVALLAVVVLDRALCFAATGAPRPLGMAFVLAAVSCTLHPSGLVAIAGLVPAIGPFVHAVRHARRAAVHGAAMAGCGLAAGVLVLFADTDVERWRVTRAAFAADGFHHDGPFDELSRYRDLLANGTTLQLAAVVAAGLALVSWIVAVVASCTRRPAALGGSPRAGVTLMPGLVLAIGAALLVLTPSKWIYHLGSLASLAALALGVEVERHSRAAPRLRMFVPVVVAAAGLGARALLHPKDPQYFLGIGVPDVGVLEQPVTWVALGGAAVVAGAASVRARRVLGEWSFVATLAVVFVASMWTSIVRPALDGPAWAAPRSLLEDLARGGCPITERIDVSDLRAAVALRPAAGGASPSAAGADSPEGFVDAGSSTAGQAPQWRDLAPGDGADLVIAVRGEPRGAQVRVEWGDADGRVVAAQAPALAPRSPSVYGPAPEWQLVRVHRGGDPRPAGATSIRVVVDRGDVRALGPVAVASRSLAGVLTGHRVLVSPPQLPLLRCSELPRVAHGVAELPDVVIGFELHDRVVEIPERSSPTSPWFLADDVRPMHRLVAWWTDGHAVDVWVAEEGP